MTRRGGRNMFDNFSAEHHIARFDRQFKLIERQVGRHRNEMVRIVMAPIKFNCVGKIGRDDACLQFARQNSLDIRAAGEEASPTGKQVATKPVCAIKSRREVVQIVLALTVIQGYTLLAACEELGTFHSGYLHNVRFAIFGLLS
jgi:hypothetical protein